MPRPGTSFPLSGTEFHHLPREICIHGRIPGLPNTHLMNDYTAMYEQVMDLFNAPLAVALTNVAEPGGTLVQQRLQPSQDLWGRCNLINGTPLRALDRWPARPHFVRFDPEPEFTHILHFYTVDVNPLAPDFFDEQDRAQAVRELANYVNDHFSPLPPLPDDAQKPSWEIIAATPVWLASPCGSTDGGTPGTPPDPFPIPAANMHFHFGNGILEQLRINAQQGPAGDVVVAVLDTSPIRNDVDTAANIFNWNILLNGVDPVQHLNSGVGIDEQLSAAAAIAALQAAPPSVDFAHLSDFVPNWGQRLDQWQTSSALTRPPLRVMTYDTPDHGLFNAGIIKDIAPQADVHLIRVLDDAGMGDMLTLTLALTLLPEMPAIDAANRRKLIINLSLVINASQRDEFMKVWFPGVGPFADLHAADQARVEATFATAHSSLTDVLDWLLANDVLIVASAGNDGLTVPNAPARLPARYQNPNAALNRNVLCVGAVNHSLVASQFSNQITSSGVATLGGDAWINPATGEVEMIVSRTGIPDGVVGLFVSPTLPFNAGQNYTGWAYWAGTSFSAPIISGIAAALSIMGTINNTAIINSVQGSATKQGLGLGGADCAIFAYQTQAP